MNECQVKIESIRIPSFRDPGGCLRLAYDIRDTGLRRPVTLWKDGTLLSGRRRVFAFVLLERERIPAVFVDTVEDVAEQLLADAQDGHLATPWKWSEACRLWARLRQLDAPAAARRLDEARRRGVDLRRQTMAGKRRPGRAKPHLDYVLSVAAEPFGVSAATARRIETIFEAATAEPPHEKRELAREVLDDLDRTGNVWANYRRFQGRRDAPPVAPRPAVQVEPAPAARQLAAWERAMPQMEGLVTGLMELGPPNPDLTWDQIGPYATRLAAVRRAMEKMIKQMRETSKS